MTIPKVYGLQKTPNTDKVSIAAKYAGVEINIQTVEFGKTNKSAEYLSKFPFGKVPAMETTEGPIYESTAMAYYLLAKKPEMLGSNAYEQALVQQFICSLDCELAPAVAKVMYPLLGYASYNAADWTAAHQQLLAKLAIYDAILLPRTFLVGESITLADIAIACQLHRLFALALEPSHRKGLVNLTRWLVTVLNQPHFKQVLGEVELCTKIAEPSKPSKAAAPAPAAVAEDEDDDEAAAPAKPKEKNPLDLLPASKLNLEEWKRFYSNCKETRPVATNWFWENYDPEGYSIWRANYRYNDELKKIFMTCNLVTGLFARMDAMRKYCFGSVIIFGEDDKNEISGFFVVRGTEMPHAMTEVPDYESYEWSKVDTSDKKQVELFNDFLAWDGDLEGKTFNQGKIFK